MMASRTLFAVVTLATAAALVNGDAHLAQGAGGLDAVLEEGHSFEVGCPAAKKTGGDAACSGAGVTVVNGKCVPKDLGFTEAEANAMIKKAMTTQAATFAQKFADLKLKVMQAATDTNADIKAKTNAANGVATKAFAANGPLLTAATGALKAANTAFTSKAGALIQDATAKAAKALTAEKFGVEDAKCRSLSTPGYDQANNKCFVIDRTGFSCLDIWNKNKKAGTEKFLRDGIHTVTISNQKRQVWCDFWTRFNDDTPGWTLVAKISRYSRWHMKSGTAGTLTADGPNQYRPWKLSNADINAMKIANKGKPGAKTMAFKFYCTQNRWQDQRGQNYRGYQYFRRDCPFNANRYINSGSSGGKEYKKYCHDTAFSEFDTVAMDGRADSNDCGLGGHAGYRTYASYGWHYCSSNGKKVDSQTETMASSSSTGCGNNDGFNGESDYRSGNGHLWIR